MKPHRTRILAMQAVYLREFHEKSLEEIQKFSWIDYKIPQDEQKFAVDLIEGVEEYKKEIDNKIRKYSENWDFDRISLVSRSILKISFFQMMHMPDIVPVKVVIDEAIKIAKEYAEKDANRFINGILDSFYKQEIVAKVDA